MKRYFTILLLWFVLVAYAFLPGCTQHSPVSPTRSPSPSTAPAPTPTPYIDRYVEAFKSYESSAGICTVYDTETDTYLYSKQEAATRIYPASTTKLFTAWVALQYLAPEDTVTVGDELDQVAADASVADLQKGYTLSVSTLIEGMLLPSGNDAAYVIARYAGQRIAHDNTLDSLAAISVFMTEINQQASLKGLHGTHFVSPDGYHHPEHYTTVEDLMAIAKLALSNPIITQYVQRAQEEITFSDGTQVIWKNTNLLLHEDSPYYLKDAVGLKTGYTEKAGYVLLSAVHNPHSESLVLVLVAQCPTLESRFTETISLYNLLKSVEIV